MKKGTFLIVGILAVVLLALSYCKSQKPLFYEEDGNYFVDDNYVIAKTKPMAADDVKELIALDADSNFAMMTRGKCFLLTTVRTGRIQKLSRIAQLDNLVRLTRYTQIQKILDINKGCFELQQIDWSAFGDLKTRLDRILNKYEPSLVNGNVSIVNNQIVTSATQLKAEHLSQLDGMTVAGADEVNICADYMGPNRFTRILKTVRTVRPDKGLNDALQRVLVQYDQKIR